MRLLRPFGVLLGFVGQTRRSLARIPVVLESILVLPTMAEQLALVRSNTETLPGVLAALEGVKADTAYLPELSIYLPKLVVVEQSLEEIEGSVARLAQVADPLEGAAQRLGRASDRWPRRRGLREPAP